MSLKSVKPDAEALSAPALKGEGEEGEGDGRMDVRMPIIRRNEMEILKKPLWH
ncbi:MAG: hypothetical protein IJC48_03225 [Clostridia bacterium]|nr:hypothetical protein [Clostridia bacterium]MBQ4157752.1 hypothetical protein [Clostridia bacterium]